MIRDATIQMIMCRKLNLLLHADLDYKYPVGNMFKMVIRIVLMKKNYKYSPNMQQSKHKQTEAIHLNTLLLGKLISH